MSRLNWSIDCVGNVIDGDEHTVALIMDWDYSHLISATVDLLIACESMRRTMYSSDSEQSKLADRAIAKAKRGMSAEMKDLLAATAQQIALGIGGGE